MSLKVLLMHANKTLQMPQTHQKNEAAGIVQWRGTVTDTLDTDQKQLTVDGDVVSVE